MFCPPNSDTPRNYPTKTKYDDALIVKGFGFSAVNFYFRERLPHPVPPARQARAATRRCSAARRTDTALSSSHRRRRRRRRRRAVLFYLSFATIGSYPFSWEGGYLHGGKLWGVQWTGAIKNTCRTVKMQVPGRVDVHVFVPDCMYELEIQLLLVFLLKTVFEQALEMGKPFAKKYAKMILLPFWKQYLFLRKKRRNLVKAMKGLARRRLAARTDACMQVGGGTTGAVASFVLRLLSVRRPPALLKSRSQLR